MLAAHFFQHASVDWISVVDTLWLLGSTVLILRLHRIMMSSTSVDSTHAVEIQQISKQLEHILKQQDFIISVLEDLSSVVEISATVVRRINDRDQVLAGRHDRSLLAGNSAGAMQSLRWTLAEARREARQNELDSEEMAVAVAEARQNEVETEEMAAAVAVEDRSGLGLRARRRWRVGSIDRTAAAPPRRPGPSAAPHVDCDDEDSSEPEAPNKKLKS